MTTEDYVLCKKHLTEPHLAYVHVDAYQKANLYCNGKKVRNIEMAYFRSDVGNDGAVTFEVECVLSESSTFSAFDMDAPYAELRTDPISSLVRLGDVYGKLYSNTDVWTRRVEASSDEFRRTYLRMRMVFGEKYPVRHVVPHSELVQRMNLLGD